MPRDDAGMSTTCTLPGGQWRVGKRSRTIHRLGAAFALALAFACPASAQALKDDFAETWTTRDGLPHSTVNAIEQTADGYLWLATWEGIARYNGREFRLFRRGEIPGLRDDSVRAMHLGPRGDLWAGCARGSVMRLRQGRWTALPPVQGLVTALHEEPGGRLWVGTVRRGVTRIDPDGRRRIFTVAQGLPSDAINHVTHDAAGRVWVATTLGLARIQGDRAVPVPAVAGLPTGPVHALLALPDGRLLVGTERGVHVSSGTGFSPLHPGLAADAVIEMRRDGDGTLWFGTLASGLARLAGGELERLGVEDGLPNSRVLALRRDREGSLWAGTNGGLVRLRRAPIRTYTRTAGLSDDFVRAVMGDARGRVWIGTSKGLNQTGAGAGTPRPVGAGTVLDRQSVLSLAPATAGGLWVGTFHRGAVRWDGQGIAETIDSTNGLPSNEVRAILDTGDGRVWLGTREGLVRRSAGRLDILDTRHGLPGNYVQSLHRDRSGRIWVGTGNGAARVEGDRLVGLDLSTMDDAQYVFAFVEIPGQDGLWLGTDRGLVRLGVDGRLQRVGRAQGLPFEKVFAAVVDRQGTLWLTGNEGIGRVNPADLVAVVEGRRRRLDARLFGHSDGMLTAQANGGSTPAATIDAAGHVWVATAQGAARVDPAAAARALPPLPALVIEAFQVDGRALPPMGRLEFPAGSSRLTVQFASPGLIAARRIRYRYQLAGFSPDWVELGDRGEIQFTNLDPGRYRLALQAYVPGEPALAGARRVDFRVRPHWWQHPGARVLGLLVLGLLVTAYFLGRIRRLRRTERRLRRLVEERTEALQVQTRLAEHLARTDALTALANRRALDEALAAALAREGATPCLLLVDIDHFKQVNDRYSHAAGDLALRAVADILQGHAGANALAARWGGEEFALLLDGDTPESACRIAEQVRARVAGLDCGAFAPGLRMSTSIGVACGQGGEPPDALIARADAALYRAKREGRDRVCTDMETPAA